MPQFEVALFNQEVRRRINEGGRHKDLSDDWADIHYIEIEARDEANARVKIEARYPEAQGYVIESVSSAD